MFRPMRRFKQQISDEECKEVLISEPRGVLSVLGDDGYPYGIPMDHWYSETDGKLYFHCAKDGRKIEILTNNNKVCFTIFSEGEPIHAETPCNSGYYYSSIIGNGRVEFIEDSEEKKYALKRMFVHQAERDVDFTDEQAANVSVFKIVSKDYTGKRKPKM